MPNNDYILRSDALEAMMTCRSLTGVAKLEAVNHIMPIPSADVEPKRKSGRWIIAGAFDDFYQCPECGEMWPIFSTIKWNCCPICECKIITNRPKGEGECLSK